MANTRNYQNQGGSTWVVTGNLEVQSSGIIEIESGGSFDIKSGANQNIDSGGFINVSSGGQIAAPVTSCTSTDGPIPNYGICIINSSGKTNDTREVAQPTRAGLTLQLVANSGTTIGVNVCVASGTSLADCTIESSGASKTVWEIIGSTQTATLVSANTSQWFVVGPITGTLSTDGST